MGEVKGLAVLVAVEPLVGLPGVETAAVGEVGTHFHVVEAGEGVGQLGVAGVPGDLEVGVFVKIVG